MDSDERAALNYDCNYNLLLAKRLIKKLVKLQGDASIVNKSPKSRFKSILPVGQFSTNISESKADSKIFLRTFFVALNPLYKKDRKLVVQWLKYLMSFNENLSEMELRNDFMYHLVLNMQEGSLKPPFSSQPSTKTPISELTHLIPGRSDKTMTVEEMMAEIDGDVNLGSNKPLVMEKSPDGGAFFAQQPMPHEGAFAYLTISTKAHRSMKKCPLD